MMTSGDALTTDSIVPGAGIVNRSGERSALHREVREVNCEG
jgi:hypothetical protein